MFPFMFNPYFGRRTNFRYVNSDITTNVTKDFKELDELRAEVKELKQLLQNISTVRPEENNIDPLTEEKENEI